MVQLLAVCICNANVCGAKCNFSMTKLTFWLGWNTITCPGQRSACGLESSVFTWLSRTPSARNVFPPAWALNPSYAFVYLFATFRCLLLTCVNQSCESEWCVDSHASVSIWLSQQINGEMPELMPSDKWAGSAEAVMVLHHLQGWGSALQPWCCPALFHTVPWRWLPKPDQSKGFFYHLQPIIPPKPPLKSLHPARCQRRGKSVITT